MRNLIFLYLITNFYLTTYGCQQNYDFKDDKCDAIPWSKNYVTFEEGKFAFIDCFHVVEELKCTSNCLIEIKKVDCRRENIDDDWQCSSYELLGSNFDFDIVNITCNRFRIPTQGKITSCYMNYSLKDKSVSAKILTIIFCSFVIITLIISFIILIKHCCKVKATTNSERLTFRDQNHNAGYQSYVIHPNQATVIRNSENYYDFHDPPYPTPLLTPQISHCLTDSQREEKIFCISSAEFC